LWDEGVLSATLLRGGGGGTGRFGVRLGPKHATDRGGHLLSVRSRLSRRVRCTARRREGSYSHSFDPWEGVVNATRSAPARRLSEFCHPIDSRRLQSRRFRVTP